MTPIMVQSDDPRSGVRLGVVQEGRFFGIGTKTGSIFLKRKKETLKVRKVSNFKIGWILEHEERLKYFMPCRT